jgi:hypothetical protein
MKKLIIFMALSLGILQVASAAVVPTELIGSWLFNGKITDPKSGIIYVQNPEVVIFNQEGTVEFSMKLNSGTGDARVGACLITAKATITSIKQTSPNSYFIEAMGRVIPEKTYPLPGTTMKKCMNIVNDYPFNVDIQSQFPISNLNNKPFNESFGMFGHTYKKIFIHN